MYEVKTTIGVVSQVTFFRPYVITESSFLYLQAALPSFCH